MLGTKLFALGSRNAFNSFMKTQRMDAQLVHVDSAMKAKGITCPVILLPGWQEYFRLRGELQQIEEAIGYSGGY